MTEQIELFETYGFNNPTFTPTEQTMSNSKKSRLNKLHYEKHRLEILMKAKDRYRRKKISTLNVIPLFGSAGSSTKVTNDSPSRENEKELPHSSIGTLGLWVLVAGFSYFLVSETAAYFTGSDMSKLAAVFRAVLLECAVLAFWLKKSQTKTEAFFQKLMAVLIYAFSVCVISGNVFQTAFQQRAEVIQSRSLSTELESEIKKLTHLRDQFFQTNRITLGMRTDQAVADLKNQLKTARQRMLQLPDQKSVLNNLFIQVVFRLLIMVSNLFALSELSRRYRHAT